MRSINKLIPTSLFSIFLLLSVTTAFGQTNNPPTANTNTGFNEVVILMGTITIVLAFVIWGMGQVLITISRQALEKSKAAKNNVPVIVMLLGLSLISFSGNAQTPTSETVTTVANYGGMSGTAFWMICSVIFVEILTILFIMFSIRRIQAELLPQTQKQAMPIKNWWKKWDKRLFTRAVSVEREADIMLDHDYDGIKELDNSLPPWWKYGFIITIIIAFAYLLNYHVLGYGQNPIQEYQEEMVKAAEKKEIFEAKSVDKVDEANLKMPETAGINAGKEIFNSVCWTCHGKLGEGGAGPNLTDDYWIHKGSLTDIYLSIKHGYPDKGMQAWEKNYSPKEINDLAGYIKTLKGTNPPNPKAAQGDLFTETNTSDTTQKAIVKEDKTIVTKTAKSDSSNNKK